MAHLRPFHRSGSGMKVKDCPPKVAASPTAMHMLAEAHEIPLMIMSGPAGPAGAGISSAVQVRPFQRIATAVLVSPRVKLSPTAMHALAEVQEMPVREVLMPCGSGARPGMAITAQVRPFQRIATAVPVSPKLKLPPTPMHAVAEVHATAFRVASPSPPGMPGSFCAAHFRPFQRSATGSELASPLLSVPPTAVHSEADGHDTPPRKPAPGVPWMAHVRPVERSASGSSRPDCLVSWPTAMHEPAARHDMAARELYLARPGTPGRCTDQA